MIWYFTNIQIGIFYVKFYFHFVGQKTFYLWKIMQTLESPKDYNSTLLALFASNKVPMGKQSANGIFSVIYNE